MHILFVVSDTRHLCSVWWGRSIVVFIQLQIAEIASYLGRLGLLGVVGHLAGESVEVGHLILHMIGNLVGIDLIEVQACSQNWEKDC